MDAFFNHSIIFIKFSFFKKLMNSKLSFPIYRKLSNGRSFYKIISETSFIELQQMGTKVIRYEVNAKQYPEILRIKDMINVTNEFEELAESDYMKLDE